MTMIYGRDVELRRGYKYDPVFGKIGSYVIIRSWEDLPDSIKIEIIPETVKSDPSTIEFLKAYFEKYPSGLIAFEIILRNP
jgi:hypothetical protein